MTVFLAQLLVRLAFVMILVIAIPLLFVACLLFYPLAKLQEAISE